MAQHKVLADAYCAYVHPEDAQKYDWQAFISMVKAPGAFDEFKAAAEHLNNYDLIVDICSKSRILEMQVSVQPFSSLKQILLVECQLKEKLLRLKELAQKIQDNKQVRSTSKSKVDSVHAKKIKEQTTPNFVAKRMGVQKKKSTSKLTTPRLSSPKRPVTAVTKKNQSPPRASKFKADDIKVSVETLRSPSKKTRTPRMTAAAPKKNIEAELI